MVNMSSHDLCCSTPIRQITPITPKDIMESFLASSSILSCRGVRFSSTWRTRQRHIHIENHPKYTYILHHRENNPKFSVGASGDDNTRSPPYHTLVRPTTHTKYKTKRPTIPHQRPHISNTHPLRQRHRLPHRFSRHQWSLPNTTLKPTRLDTLSA